MSATTQTTVPSTEANAKPLGKLLILKVREHFFNL